MKLINLFLFSFAVYFLQSTEGSSTKVYVTGLNTKFQLGIEGIIYINQFQENFDLEGIIQLAAGNYHVLALFENGTVKGFGDNDFGELGFGDYVTRDIPTVIPNLNNVTSCYAGSYSSMIVLNNGSVYVFGDNKYGQLGLGIANNTISIPVSNPYLNGYEIQKMALADDSLILLTNGSVLSFGLDDYGELCQGIFNRSFPFPKVIENIENAIDIAVGTTHSLILLYNGSLFVCGNNKYGQLGLGPNVNSTNLPIIIPNLNNVTRINCGQYFSYAILSNGSVFSWGYNFYGELGLNSTMNVFTPTQISGISNAVDFLIGYDHVFLLLENGTIIGVGNNDFGQLGLGEFNRHTTFVPISFLNNLGNILFNRTSFRADSSYFLQGLSVNTGSSSEQEPNLIPAIVIPIVLVIFALSMLFGFVYFYKRRRNSFSIFNVQLKDSINQNVTLKKNELIGGSKRIFKGTYTGKEVALKKIINNMNEYNFFKKIERNPNTVEFFGIYEYDGDKYLILELLSSSLSKYLKSNENLPVDKLIKFIQQIANRLEYFEETGIIHGNICCENILRKENNQLKLCDFELSHSIYNPLILSEKDLSRIQFCAPEVKKNRKYDKKSDVWSWSVTCIQIFYLNQQNNEEQSFQMNEQILNSKPSQCPEDLWNLIQKGLNSDPSLRPSFKEIEDECKKVLKAVQEEAFNKLVVTENNEEEDPYLSFEDKKENKYL